jgi:hypothetical protein
VRRNLESAAPAASAAAAAPSRGPLPKLDRSSYGRGV